MIYIGIDDTDTRGTRGTGHLAREIAAQLAADYHMGGVLRHQLLVDPAIPYTAKNSCAAILLDETGLDLIVIFERVRAIMLADFIPGSDPGLAVAENVPAAICRYGQRAQQTIIKQGEAQQLANAHGILLHGLGGTNDGIIGALAALGLAAGGNDGRYVIIGQSRELAGSVPVAAVLAAGITAVRTVDGMPISDGTIQADKLRPARRESKPILFVEPAPNNDDVWLPLKLD